MHNLSPYKIHCLEVRWLENGVAMAQFQRAGHENLGLLAPVKT